MAAAEWIVRGLALYALIGVVVGVAFVVWGVQEVDPGAKGAHKAFRLIILPGVAAFWPVVLRQWMGAKHRGRP